MNKTRNYNTRVKNLTTLGSKGTISSPHRNLDFKHEARIIKSPLRMIKTNNKNKRGKNQEKQERTRTIHYKDT